MNSTVKKTIGWGFGLIFAYLVLVNATGAAKDESATAQGGATLVRAFQGR